MKSKKIKKLAKLLYHESRNLELKSSPREDYQSQYDWCEFDEEVSNKFKKLVANISNYSNNIHVRVQSDKIFLQTEDFKTIKSPRKARLLTASEENHLEISIFKDLGFTINQGYTYRTSYKDPNMFEQLKEEISLRLKKVNSENFNHIWSNIMTETKLSRDNNLDEILNG